MPKHPHPTVTQLQVIIGLAERIHSEVEAIPAVYTGRSRHLRASPATIARNQAAEYIERAGDLLAKPVMPRASSADLLGRTEQRQRPRHTNSTARGLMPDKVPFDPTAAQTALERLDALDEHFDIGHAALTPIKQQLQAAIDLHDGLIKLIEDPSPERALEGDQLVEIILVALREGKTS